MADTKDILQRISARLPLETEELMRCYKELTLVVHETLASGDHVELMTFGTLRRRGGELTFTGHASLFPDGEAMISS